MKTETSKTRLITFVNSFVPRTTFPNWVRSEYELPHEPTLDDWVRRAKCCSKLFDVPLPDEVRK